MDPSFVDRSHFRYRGITLILYSLYNLIYRSETLQQKHDIFSMINAQGEDCWVALIFFRQTVVNIIHIRD